jgi:hypothetical protein
MAEEWTTHTVELHASHVVKRYRPLGKQEHEREWQALTSTRKGRLIRTVGPTFIVENPTAKEKQNR